LSTAISGEPEPTDVESGLGVGDPSRSRAEVPRALLVTGAFRYSRRLERRAVMGMTKQDGERGASLEDLDRPSAQRISGVFPTIGAVVPVPQRPLQVRVHLRPGLSPQPWPRVVIEDSDGAGRQSIDGEDVCAPVLSRGSCAAARGAPDGVPVWMNVVALVALWRRRSAR
jgi:hypothetical protein